MGGMLSAELRHVVPVFALTRLRVGASLLLLAAVATWSGGWSSVHYWHLPYLAISGVVGMVVADAALSGSIYAFGARNAALVFSMNAPIAACLGYLFLSETLWPLQILGIFLTVFGIALAVLFGTRPGEVLQAATAVARQLAALQDRRLLVRGLLLALLAALAQAMSVLLARPVMAEPISASAAMSVRLAAAGLVLIAILPFDSDRGKTSLPAPRLLLMGVASAWIGVAAGVTFVFAALHELEMAVVVTLAAMTPIAVLPMVWLRTGRIPRWQSWCGATIAVAGVSLVLSD